MELSTWDSIITVTNIYSINKERLNKKQKNFLDIAIKTIGEDKEARFELAVLYFKGEGIYQDYTRARELFEKTSNMFLSKCFLGLIHFHGYEVKVDYNKAREYFEPINLPDFPEAMYCMAYIYFYCDKDYDATIKLLKDDALKCYPKAHYLLGMIYYAGKGVKKDFKKAVEFFEQADDVPEALWMLARIYLLGEEDIIEDKDKAKLLFKAATDKGHNTAKLNLRTFFK